MMVKIILIKFNFNSIDLPNVHTHIEVEEQLNNCVVCPPRQKWETCSPCSYEAKIPGSWHLMSGSTYPVLSIYCA